MRALTSADMMRQALSAGRYDNVHGQAFSPQQVNKAAVESGQAAGFRLQMIEDPMASFVDSLEELSMQFEEKTMKTLGDRKIGEKRGPNAAYFIAVQQWQKVMADMPGGAFMERMLRQLRMKDYNNRMPDLREFLDMLGEGSSDPSHQFAMLDVMRKALGKGDERIVRLVEMARKHLEETKGAEIRAGINLSTQVAAQAGDADEMQHLRDLYRGEVLGYQGPQQCFRSLLAKEGAGRMSASINFLIEGCGVDIQSPKPSQSPEELRRIVQDLQCVNVLTSVMERADALAGKMERQFGEKCRLDGEGMTGRLLDLTEKQFTSADDIKAFIAACGITKPLAKVYFCMGLMDQIRSLSSRLFADEANRIRLVAAGQEHLDALVLEQEKIDAVELKGSAA